MKLTEASGGRAAAPKKAVLKAGVVLAVSAAMALTGCTSGSNGGNSNGSGKSSSDVKGATVTVWVQSGAMGGVQQKFLKEWSKSNKDDITADVKVMDSDSFNETLQLALKSGQGPDVFPVPGPPTYIQAGLLAPLNKLVDPATLKTYQKAVAPPSVVQKNGKVYAIPTSTNTTRLAYNKDIFKAAGLDPSKPPKTFSQVEKDCKAIMDSGQSGVYCFGVPAKWPGMTSWMIDPLVVSTAPSKLTVKGLFNIKTQKFDMEKYAPAVKMYRKIVANGWAYPGASSLDNNAMRSAFANGKIGMFVSASWDPGTINGQYKSTANWAAARVPVPNDATFKGSIMNIGHDFAISSASKKKQAAAIVLDALAGTKLNTELGVQGLAFPYDPKAAAAARKADHPHPQYAQFTATKSDVIWLNSPTDQLSIQGKTFKQVLVSLILGTGDIDSTLADQSKRYTDAYEQAVKNGTIDPTVYGGKKSKK